MTAIRTAVGLLVGDGVASELAARHGDTDLPSRPAVHLDAQVGGPYPGDGVAGPLDEEWSAGGGSTAPPWAVN